MWRRLSRALNLRLVRRFYHLPFCHGGHATGRHRAPVKVTFPFDPFQSLQKVSMAGRGSLLLTDRSSADQHEPAHGDGPCNYPEMTLISRISADKSM